MNIIITLPMHLVADIANCHKRIEIRKSRPKHFNAERDIVWVKVKGSDKLAMCFKISYFEKGYDLNAVWNRYHGVIGVLYAWWEKYVRNADVVYIWHIKNVFVLQPPLTFSKTFPGVKAHQSYIYTNVTLQSVMHLVEHVECCTNSGETRSEVPRKKAIQ